MLPSSSLSSALFVTPPSSLFHTSFYPSSFEGISQAACKEACLRTSTDPRYSSLTPLMGSEGSPSRTPYNTPFLGSSLAWIGGSLFASLKVRIVLLLNHFTLLDGRSWLPLLGKLSIHMFVLTCYETHIQPFVSIYCSRVMTNLSSSQTLRRFNQSSNNSNRDSILHHKNNLKLLVLFHLKYLQLQTGCHCMKRIGHSSVQALGTYAYRHEGRHAHMQT